METSSWGWFKINTDAAIQAERLRIVIKDSKGSFVAVAMKKLKP